MIGQTVGHYTISEELGRGGMGIVYKGYDTKLEREVALKFLPPHLSASEQDQARFMQEARAAATLDHPNICTIYSIEQHEKQMFIVMQFVDGQLLRDRISGLSTRQAVELGIQIAEGLAAAHAKGVVHRDIKPENIMVRKDGIPQIMDFGLAKLKGVSRLTKEGSTVGTAGYMSPEQVQGLDADHRSDIFSLGVLLYEMFTGQLPFKGVHETAVAYEIVNVDAPPMTVLKPDIDPALDAIILECLEKDPKERMQSAGQVSVDLKRYRRESSRQRASRITSARPSFSTTTSSTKVAGGMSEATEKSMLMRMPLWPLISVVAVIMLLAGYGASRLIPSGSQDLQVLRVSINMPEGVGYADGVGGHSSISPDGSMVVFSGWDSLGRQRLRVRRLDGVGVRDLEGTENANYPFWSPDSRSIGFFAGGKLRTISAEGGPVLALADAPFGRGAAWGGNGTIVYSASVTDRNLTAISSAGGSTHPVTAFDSTTGAAPRFPFFLPDGKRFLFSMLELEGSTNNSDVHIGSLDNSGTRVLLKGVSHAMYASGQLLFFRQGILMAQQFDPDNETLTGEPIAIQANINSWSARAKADFSVSENGILLYVGKFADLATSFIKVEKDGNETILERANPMMTAVLSPDRSKIAYDEHDGKKADVWIYDLEKRVKTRLTFAPNGAVQPCWSHDGTRIYYNAEIGSSKANLLVKQADGSGEEELLAYGKTETDVGYYPFAESPDGKVLLITVSNELGSELATLDLHNPERPIPVVKLGIKGRGATLSPDGKWIVYNSLETGGNLLFITSLKGKAGKWQVPVPEGSRPMWGDGKILFYSPVTDRYETVEVSSTSGVPAFGLPKPLFMGGRTFSHFLYGELKNGKGYIGLKRDDGGSSGQLSLIVNWTELVRPRAQ